MTPAVSAHPSVAGSVRGKEEKPKKADGRPVSVLKPKVRKEWVLGALCRSSWAIVGLYELFFRHPDKACSHENERVCVLWSITTQLRTDHLRKTCSLRTRGEFMSTHRCQLARRQWFSGSLCGALAASSLVLFWAFEDRDRAPAPLVFYGCAPVLGCGGGVMEPRPKTELGNKPERASEYLVLESSESRSVSPSLRSRQWPLEPSERVVSGEKKCISLLSVLWSGRSPCVRSAISGERRLLVRPGFTEHACVADFVIYAVLPV